MHQFPFGAQMTDKLFQLVQDPGSRPEVNNCLPSIAWVPERGVGGLLEFPEARL
jgi:hypothetical protein